MESWTIMDHRDDVRLYEDLRGAHASARADTWRRSRSMFRLIANFFMGLVRTRRDDQ